MLRMGIALISLSILLIACGGTGEPLQSPRVQVTSAPVLTSTPRPTSPPVINTPVPTTFQFWTSEAPQPTPRQVSVSRVSDSVDPTQNLLIQTGQSAPPVVLTDIDGNVYQLDELAGRAVILNFWTVGCGSCFYEFPLLQEARDRFTDEDVLILAINVSDLAEETRVIAENLGATYPMIVDPDGEIFINFFGGAVVPTTYFIAPDGTVEDTLVGPMDTAILNSALSAMGIDTDIG